MVKYSTISLPKELYEILQDIIDKRQELGYNSVADFCKEAIRIHLHEIKKELREDFWRKLDIKGLLKKIDMISAYDGSLYEDAFKKIKDMAFVLSKDFKIKNVNNAFISYLGYEKKEDVFNLPIKKFIEDGEEFIKELKKSGYVRDFPTKMIRRDSKKYHVLITANAVKNDYFGVAKDITVYKIVEEKNRKMKELYEHIINNLYNSILVIQNGKIKFVNKAITKSGYSMEDLIGKKVSDFVIEEDRERLTKTIEEKLKGKSIGKATYYTVRCKNGKKARVEALSTRIEYEGKPALLSCIKFLENCK